VGIGAGFLVVAAVGAMSMPRRIAPAQS